MYSIINEVIVPQRHLWVWRYQPVTVVQFHATRGPTTPDLQYVATKNWMQSPNNNQGNWGGSCSYIIGRYEGQCCRVLEDNQMCTFSAGYGGSGTYSIDEWGPSIELGQSPDGEDYTDHQYDRAARICADAHVNHGVPVQFIEVWDQRGPAPQGYVRHDRSQNGVKLGKSDPGPAFDELRLLARVREILSGVVIADPVREDDHSTMRVVRIADGPAEGTAFVIHGARAEWIHSHEHWMALAYAGVITADPNPERAPGKEVQWISEADFKHIPIEPELNRLEFQNAVGLTEAQLVSVLERLTVRVAPAPQG